MKIPEYNAFSFWSGAILAGLSCLLIFPKNLEKSYNMGKEQGKSETTTSFQKEAIKAHIACYDEETSVWHFKSTERIAKEAGVIPEVNPVLPAQNIDPVLTAEQVEKEIEKEKSKKK